MKKTKCFFILKNQPAPLILKTTAHLGFINLSTDKVAGGCVFPGVCFFAC